MQRKPIMELIEQDIDDDDECKEAETKNRRMNNNKNSLTDASEAINTQKSISQRAPITLVYVQAHNCYTNNHRGGNVKATHFCG